MRLYKIDLKRVYKFQHFISQAILKYQKEYTTCFGRIFFFDWEYLPFIVPFRNYSSSD